MCGKILTDGYLNLLREKAQISKAPNTSHSTHLKQHNNVIRTIFHSYVPLQQTWSVASGYKTLVIVQGVTCCGKSTIIKNFLKDISYKAPNKPSVPLLVINPKEIHDLLVETSLFDITNDCLMKDTANISKLLIHIGLDYGTNIIVDGALSDTVLLDEKFLLYLQLEYGPIYTMILHITASIETIQHRKMKQRLSYQSISSFVQVTQYYSIF